MAKEPPISNRGKLTTRVKTARGRRKSSTRWLQRQLNDPYVHAAQKAGYRSRAAFKIIELNEKFHLFAPGKKILDLGAAPGGWTQIAVQETRSQSKSPTVVGIDLLEMDHIEGALCEVMDFMADDAPARLRTLMPEGVDVVLSDMAPNTTGHAATDHLRIMVLLEAAHEFACEVLSPGGAFVAKIFQGGTEKELLTLMRQRFHTVKHFKPKSSRADSSEMYVVALDFKG